MSSVNHPDWKTKQYEYDPIGNRAHRTDAKDVLRIYEYDLNDRLTTITPPDLSISYGYDNVGNRTSMTDATGTTTFNYDALNRLSYVIYPGGKRIDYTYDEVGNQTSITTAFGIVSYAYDDSNRLLNLTLPNSQVVNYQYFPSGQQNAGNLQRIDYPNGTYTTYGYDIRNRLLSLSNNKPGDIISEYAYTLDGVGNRRLTSFEEPLSRSYTLGTTNYTYLTGNRLSSAGTTTYNYDLNGNLSTKIQSGTTTNYTFDSQDRLTQVSSPSENYQYQYDGLWNRVSKTDSGTTTRYLADPNGFLPQVIAEMDGSGNITSYYVYDGVGLVAKMTSQSVHFYHYDGLGSTIAMTDSSGNMVNKYAYDAFGSLLNAEEAVSNPFLYVGQYGVMDEDNGLLFMRARYYDPEVGRFISKDPIGFGGGLNLYGYAANNPVNRIDPRGLDAVRIPWPRLIPWRIPVPNPIIIIIGIVLWPSEIAEEPVCEGWREQCISLYVKCKEEDWVGPCGICLNKCTAQHEWDFNMCHPIQRY